MPRAVETTPAIHLACAHEAAMISQLGLAIMETK